MEKGGVGRFGPIKAFLGEKAQPHLDDEAFGTGKIVGHQWSIDARRSWLCDMIIGQTAKVVSTVKQKVRESTDRAFAESGEGSTCPRKRVTCPKFGKDWKCSRALEENVDSKDKKSRKLPCKQCD